MRERPDNLEKSDWLMETKPSPNRIQPDRPLPTKKGILSPAEIEALLRPASLTSAPAPPQTMVAKESVDFAHDQAPVHADADQARQLWVASRLTLMLGRGAGFRAAVSAQEHATVTRSDLSGLLQTRACAIACLGPDENDIRALVCLPPKLADALIAQACGARGSTGRIGDGWTLSAIDCALLEQLLSGLGAAIGPDLHLQAIETDASYVASLIPSDRVQVSEFGVEAPGLRSELAVIETDPETDPDRATATGDTGGEKLPVTALVTARIASLSVPLSHLTALKAGSTLLLGLPGDQPVEVLSGGRDGAVVFEGQMGRKGNKMAVRITAKKRTVTA